MEVLPVDLGVPQGAEDPPADEGLHGHLEQTRNRALRMGRVEWSSQGTHFILNFCGDKDVKFINQILGSQ